jgi:hypothetical protein
MKEHLKTILLVLLGLSAAVLVYRTWIYDHSLFGREGQEPVVFAPERLDYAPASVSPAKCAVMDGGVRSGAQYDAETSVVYNAFKLLLAEAIGTVVTAGRDEMWRETLRGDGVYFEFTGSLPLSLLAAWLSADSSRLSAAGVPLDDGVKSVGLAFDGGSVRLFWATADGDFWLAGTEAEFAQWPELPELRPCAFAFESAHTGGWEPRQLFMEETRPRPAFTVSAPPDIRQADSVYAPFLEKLELFANSTTFYDRSDGRVYVDVENGHTCAILADGAILFSTPAMTAAEAVSIASGGHHSAAADVLRAWEALSRLEPAIGGGQFEVYRVTQTAVGTAAEFLLTFDGVPVRWESAVVEVRDGSIVRVTLRLCQIEAGNEDAVPLPLRQATALAPLTPAYAGHGGRASLELRYYASSPDGDWTVMWVVPDELG